MNTCTSRIIMASSVWFVLLASIYCVIASPLNVSESVTTNECGCSGDIQQIHAKLREFSEELARLKAQENNEPDIKEAADLPANIQERTVFLDVIGFTARVSSFVTDLPLGSTVLFDDIVYNAGNHYDPSTGVFTCPRSGMYLFSVFVESHSQTTITAAQVTIKTNGNDNVQAISEPTELGHDTSGGNMFIKHIQKGDRVWVETYQTDNQNLHAGFNTFSGVLIHSTENAP